MKKIILCGANGKMGHVIRNIVAADNECEIVAGVDINTESTDFPIYSEIDSVKESADVIIDFLIPRCLIPCLNIQRQKKIPVVIATTGFDDDQKKQIENAATENGVFFTYNMSLGINLLATLAKKAVDVLGNDFDIEIIEKHHNQKIDAPSGTALMLADAICEEIDKPMKYEYDRHSKREKRSKNEIGMHAVRGGTIVGEHEIIFAGRDEIITLSHSARSKEIFAVGAVNAAKYMVGKGAGLYTMKDLIK